MLLEHYLNTVKKFNINVAHARTLWTLLQASPSHCLPGFYCDPKPDSDTFVDDVFLVLADKYKHVSSNELMLLAQTTLALVIRTLQVILPVGDNDVHLY